MYKLSLFMAVGIFVFSGCVRVEPVGISAKKAPPGQVQKATGYNPASGKVKMK